MLKRGKHIAKSLGCITPTSLSTVICREIRNTDGTLAKQADGTDAIWLIGASGASGTIEPTWIQCGTNYLFVVHVENCNGPEVSDANVYVTRIDDQCPVASTQAVTGVTFAPKAVAALPRLHLSTSSQ